MNNAKKSTNRGDEKASAGDIAVALAGITCVMILLTILLSDAFKRIEKLETRIQAIESQIGNEDRAS